MAIIGGSIAVAGLLLSAPVGVADHLLSSDRGMDMAPAVLALGVALIAWSAALWGLVEPPEAERRGCTRESRGDSSAEVAP
jgi:hypothetical protein